MLYTHDTEPTRSWGKEQSGNPGWLRHPGKGPSVRSSARAGFIIMATALLLSLPIMAAAAPPDLTQGGKPDSKHRLTLGTSCPSRVVIGTAMVREPQFGEGRNERLRAAFREGPQCRPSADEVGRIMGDLGAKHDNLARPGTGCRGDRNANNGGSPGELNGRAFTELRRTGKGVSCSSATPWSDATASERS